MTEQSPDWSPAFEGKARVLADRAVFRLTGADRVRYLNGQVSADLAGPLSSEAKAACLCSIKGKVEALVWVQADADALYLDAEIAQREAIHARLERYLIADDCEVEDLTDQARLVHHFHDDLPGIRSRRFGPQGPEGRDWIGGIDDSQLDHIPAIQDEEWDLAGLYYKIPRWGLEIRGDEFPAELGLDSWAVDFHKGCYLGQEIVSRIKSAGKVRRRLRRIVAEIPLVQGTRVALEDGRVGELTRGSECFGGKKYRSLAMVGELRSVSQLDQNEEVEKVSIDD